MKTKPGPSQGWRCYDLAPSDLMVNTSLLARDGGISIMWEGKTCENDLSAFFQKAAMVVAGPNAAITLHALTNGPSAPKTLATSTANMIAVAASHFAGADFLRYDANFQQAQSTSDLVLTSDPGVGHQVVFLNPSNLPKIAEALADLIANTSGTAATQQSGYDRSAALTKLRRIASDFAVP